MKKVVLIVTLSFAFITGSFANNSSAEYFLDEVSVEALVATSEEVSLPQMTSVDLKDVNGMTRISAEKNKTVFLLLNFFLGGLAIHRYYMGVDGKWAMFLLYGCVPVAGTVASCGDLLYVGFGTATTHEEYADNGKWFVWAGN